jgi:hypothetical protein
VDDVFLLELHDRLSDLGDVLIEDLSLKDGEEFWIIVHDLLPVALSDGVTLALGVSPMDEDLTLIEANVESSDDSVLSKSQLELFSLVYLITDVIVSLLDEQDLVDFVQLHVNDFTITKDAWLQWLENLDHEVLVLHVIPGIETVINSNLLVLSSILFGEIKELSEVLDELFEQEITINLTLNRSGELIEKFLVLVSTYRLILVVDPAVVEILFDLELKIIRDGSAWVESFDESEPLWQVFAIIGVRIQILNGDQNLDEVSHDVREDGDSYKQNESTHASLCVTFGMIVTKTYGWKSGKSIVSHYNGILLISFFLKFEMIEKARL